MKLDVARQGDVTVLAVSGELNADSVGRFRKAVAEAMGRQQRDFLVDLGSVTTIDSAGLEGLTALQRQCEEELGMVRVCRANPTLRKVFELTRLDRQLTLCETTEEALASFGQT